MSEQHEAHLDQGELLRNIVGSNLKILPLQLHPASSFGLPFSLQAPGIPLKSSMSIAIAMDMFRNGEITVEQLRRGALEALHRMPWID